MQCHDVDASCWSHCLTDIHSTLRPDALTTRVVALTKTLAWMGCTAFSNYSLLHTGREWVAPGVTRASLRGPTGKRHSATATTRTILLFYKSLPLSSMFHPFRTPHLNQPRAAPCKCKQLFLSIEHGCRTNNLGW